LGITVTNSSRVLFVSVDVLLLRGDAVPSGRTNGRLGDGDRGD
jgi:hypothetical protein